METCLNIVSSNCVGGKLYRMLGVRYGNPFIWTSIRLSDFIKLIEDYDRINFSNFRYIVDKRHPCKHVPALRIDEHITIDYTHYHYSEYYENPFIDGLDVFVKDIKEYIYRKYNSRLSNINESPTFIYDDIDGFTDIDVSKFIQCQTPYNKILVTQDKSLQQYETSNLRVILKPNRNYHSLYIAQDILQDDNIKSFIGIKQNIKYPILKVWCSDIWKGFCLRQLEIYKILNSRFCVILDKSNPQLLIHSVFGEEYKQYDCLKLRISGECDKRLDISDFYIGQNKNIRQDNYLWMPYHFYCGMHYHGLVAPMDEPRVKSDGSGMCFLVSNERSKERIRFYKYLSQYYKIDSGGKVLNNIGYILPKDVNVTRKFYKDHKFCIAYENEQHNGYLTEKIFSALCNGCIPIYKGDPLIEEVVNPKCFINANNLSDEEILGRIREINTNEELRQSMLREPILIKPIECYHKQLEEFMNKVIERLCSNK